MMEGRADGMVDHDRMHWYHTADIVAMIHNVNARHPRQPSEFNRRIERPKLTADNIKEFAAIVVESMK
jgi:hypothetical protein